MSDQSLVEVSFPDSDHDHASCAAALMRRAERTCERDGVRLTSLRRDVLGAVGESHQAAGAYDIIERLARSGPRPAPISIYRALDFLTALGLVHRIESRNAYVACSRRHEGGRAVLMVCDGCGTVGELDAPLVFEALEGLAADKRFDIRRPVVELSGRCSQCGTGA